MAELDDRPSVSVQKLAVTFLLRAALCLMNPVTRQQLPNCNRSRLDRDLIVEE